MNAVEILHDLRDQGFRFQVTGERLRVAPSQKLTDDVRAVIRAHRSEILEALTTDAEDIDADAREYLDERAAIAEYDGGLSREQAERQHIRPVFEFQLAERPGVWFTLLCQQGDTLDDARHWCEQRFGSDRLVGVRDRVLGGGS